MLWLPVVLHQKGCSHRAKKVAQALIEVVLVVNSAFGSTPEYPIYQGYGGLRYGPGGPRRVSKKQGLSDRGKCQRRDSIWGLREMRELGIISVISGGGVVDRHTRWGIRQMGGGGRGKDGEGQANGILPGPELLKLCAPEVQARFGQKPLKQSDIPLGWSEDYYREWLAEEQAYAVRKAREYAKRAGLQVPASEAPP